MLNADLANPTSWNLYAYVNGDPVNGIDSSGLVAEGPGLRPPIGGVGDNFCLVNPDIPLCGGGSWQVAKYCTAVVTRDNACGPGGGGAGNAGLTPDQLAILDAERAADDDLFKPSCAGLFLTPDQNTADARSTLSQLLDSVYDDGAGDIREIAPPSGSPANVPASTTGTMGIIYIYSGGAFFTGTVGGQPLGGWAQGMSLASFQQAVIIHEFLHYMGVVGPDNASQTYTLPNGDTVTGSDQVSQEVRSKCLN